MANKNDKVPGNTPGRFYVDVSCCDCDLCRNTAPELFGRDDNEGLSFVTRQPTTPDEELLAQTAAEGCPTSSIGNDG